jgi:glutathione peroxidase
MGLHDIPLETLKGEPSSMGELKGKAVLVVNVASRCGFTPQYEGLERLHETYGPRGFTVVGFPCNQFGGQEPGTAEQIADFCSTRFGIAFPMMAKTDVNGDERHPLFAELTQLADAEGKDGDVRWNFEKFLISPEGEPVARFRTMTTPEDSALVAAVEAALPR